MVNVVFEGTSFKRKDVKVLSQSDCTRLSYVNSSNPHKPFFLKNLFEVINLLRLETVKDVLLVDDSPQKTSSTMFIALFTLRLDLVMIEIGSSPCTCNRGWRIYLDQLRLS